MEFCPNYRNVSLICIPVTCKSKNNSVGALHLLAIWSRFWYCMVHWKVLQWHAQNGYITEVDTLASAFCGMGADLCWSLKKHFFKKHWAIVIVDLHFFWPGAHFTFTANSDLTIKAPSDLFNYEGMSHTLITNNDGAEKVTTFVHGTQTSPTGWSSKGVCVCLRARSNLSIHPLSEDSQNDWTVRKCQLRRWELNSKETIKTKLPAK